ncbi:MAG: hypothetical protein WCY05_00350 [Candidatus Omnitrophota bacterium]
MRYIINVIAILVVVVVISLVIYFKNNATTYPFQGNVQKFLKETSKLITTKKKNIGMDLSPSRKKRVTYIEKESILRQYIPWVFGDFTASDWRHFWGLIYDPIADSKSKYGQKRYRTKDEIEGYLIEHYSNPFSNFGQTQWHDFWNIVGVNIE